MQEIYLPKQEAIVESAKQNFERDVLDELVKENEWELLKESYENEAKTVIEQTGSNYIPTHIQHSHIRVHENPDTLL